MESYGDFISRWLKETETQRAKWTEEEKWRDWDHAVYEWRHKQKQVRLAIRNAHEREFQEAKDKRRKEMRQGGSIINGIGIWRYHRQEELPVITEPREPACAPGSALKVSEPRRVEGGWVVVVRLLQKSWMPSGGVMEFTIRVRESFYQEMTNGRSSVKELVRESLLFLFDRMRPYLMLRRFDLSLIGAYQDDYRHIVGWELKNPEANTRRLHLPEVLAPWRPERPKGWIPQCYMSDPEKKAQYIRETAAMEGKKEE
ncbi:MAG: hypothetical protein ABIJ96_09735 [Elusimicrobiota bacterium]